MYLIIFNYEQIIKGVFFFLLELFLHLFKSKWLYEYKIR
jgi:hypothetical protein